MESCSYMMPPRAFRIAVPCAVEIHTNAEHIVPLKYLVDTDTAVKLDFPRILESRIIQGDRAVDILAARHREYKVGHLRFLCRQEFYGKILRGHTLRLLKPLLDIAHI